MTNDVKIIIYDDYNSTVVMGGIIGTITTAIGKPTLRNGIKIIEIRKINGKQIYSRGA